jgi:DNA-binding MarR family transcriptional regulator
MLDKTYPSPSLCACTNLRRATRAITQFYDSYLLPSGLQTTQYSLLSNLSRADSVSITQFAETLGMDRTTLTRNLDPLLRRGLVERTLGEDQRVRMVRITPQGQELLSAARPLWAQAQERIVSSFGEERYYALLGELSAVEEVVR